GPPPVSAGGAGDIDEFFGTKIGPETGLSNQSIGQIQGSIGGDYRMCTVCDIGTRATVNQRWGTGQSLPQSGSKGITQQDSHGTLSTIFSQLSGRDRLPIIIFGHHDAC